jgi:phosphotransferase system enzyme I (PtsI)
MIKGTPSSAGVSWGKIMLVEDGGPARPGGMAGASPRKELERFDRAVLKGIKDILSLRDRVMERMGEKEAAIFEAQSLILEDPAIIDETRARIRAGGVGASQALKAVVRELEDQFMALKDPTLRQRVADLKDATGRVMAHLAGENQPCLSALTEKVILAARDLLPSQAAQLCREKVLGIATERGGINSHASIIARSLEIPAVVALPGLMERARQAGSMIVDGSQGQVFFDPGPPLLRKYRKLRAGRDGEEKREVPGTVQGRLLTADGEEVQIFANVGRPAEMEKLRDYGVKGIGVLRTEILLMDRQSPPSVEEYAASLKPFLQQMWPGPVHVRLLDLGADKTVPYLSHPGEANPALGIRGIRYLLSNPRLLRDQVRGILEASRWGAAGVLVPMVTTVQEVQEVQGLLRRMETEMAQEGKFQGPPLPLGIMIETPAAALLSPVIAGMADFLSIGTNDLTQYTLAADRENEHVQDIYNGLNPAVLQLISLCAASARREGIPVSICGEMAADIRAIPILTGMGIRRLSVAVGRISEVTDIVRKIPAQKARLLAAKALKASDVMDVEKMVARFLRKMEKEFKERG